MISSSLLKFVILAVAFWISNINCKSIEHIEENLSNEPPFLQFDFDAEFAKPKFIKEFNFRHNRPVEEQHPSTENPNVMKSDEGKDKKKMFLLFFNTNNDYTGVTDTGVLDRWSVLWYIASFGGFVLFFLIVSCSEWCCRMNMRNRLPTCPLATAVPGVGAPPPDTPPPSYEHFAPPSYESIAKPREKCEYDVYVVPVHALGSLIAAEEDAPPSYVAASSNGGSCA